MHLKTPTRTGLLGVSVVGGARAAIEDPEDEGAAPVRSLCALYGVEYEVWQVGISYDGKPQRRMLIKVFSAKTRLLHHRGHGSLGRLTPAEYARQCKHEHQETDSH